MCAIGWFIIIDFPTKSDGFLSPEEKDFIIARINRDRGDANEEVITLSKVLHHLQDWKLYCWSINVCAAGLPGYAFNYFLPIILRQGMGFTVSQSQLLLAPPYVFAAVVSYICGWLGDRYHIRGPILAVTQLVTASGMLITAFGGSSGVRYFGAFLGEY